MTIPVSTTLKMELLKNQHESTTIELTKFDRSTHV